MYNGYDSFISLTCNSVRADSRNETNSVNINTCITKVAFVFRKLNESIAMLPYCPLEIVENREIGNAPLLI